MSLYNFLFEFFCFSLMICWSSWYSLDNNLLLFLWLQISFPPYGLSFPFLNDTYDTGIKQGLLITPSHKKTLSTLGLMFKSLLSENKDPPSPPPGSPCSHLKNSWHPIRAKVVYIVTSSHSHSSTPVQPGLCSYHSTEIFLKPLLNPINSLGIYLNYSEISDIKDPSLALNSLRLIPF